MRLLVASSWRFDCVANSVQGHAEQYQGHSNDTPRCVAVLAELQESDAGE